VGDPTELALVDAAAQAGHGTVDQHSTLLDDFLAGPARAQPATSQIFLKSFLHLEKLPRTGAPHLSQQDNP
jgi:hypothetical protein